MPPFADNVLAISDRGEVIYYKEVDLLAKELSLEFNGEKVLVFDMTSNTSASLVGYLAFQKLHAVPLMLSNNVDKSFFLSLLNVYEPEFLWMESSRIKTYCGDVNPIFSYRDYSLIRRSIKHRVRLNDDLALLLSTSGSTGSAKLVRLSYDNILSNAESIAEYLSINSTERPITSLPMYYSYGLSVVNSHVLKGATILLTDKSVLQKDFWTFFAENGATSFAGVPYTYEMLKRIKFEDFRLPTLKTMTQAGGKLSSDLVSEFVQMSKNKGFRFFVMYGQTEATARMSYLPYLQASDKPASIGVAIPGGKFELRSEDGEVIESSDVDGELYYYGRNVFMGYAVNKYDLSQGDVVGGMLQTGDIARVDKDGFYYITGRKNRFVKIFGNRIGLDNVESLLRLYVSDCACTGNDSMINIFVTQELDFDIIGYISDKLHLYPSVFSVKVIQNIPKNESGKILYSKL